MKYAALVALLLSACDICPDASYTIKESGSTLSCQGYDDKFVYDDGDCKIVSCIWECAHYAGNPCEYVDLTFVGCGDGWALDSTFTAECI